MKMELQIKFIYAVIWNTFKFKFSCKKKIEKNELYLSLAFHQASVFLR